MFATSLMSPPIKMASGLTEPKSTGGMLAKRSRPVIVVGTGALVWAGMVQRSLGMLWNPGIDGKPADLPVMLENRLNNSETMSDTNTQPEEFVQVKTIC